MKYLFKIQKEFIKYASEWKDWSYYNQQNYLHEHPKSRRKLTNSFLSTKEDYLNNLSNEIEDSRKKNSPNTKTLILVNNFLHKYLPEKFRRTIYDEDTGDIPDYDKIVKEYNLKELIKEQVGNDIENIITVLDEKQEKFVKGFKGSDFFKIKIATGIYNNKRMMVLNYESAGQAPVYEQNSNKITHHQPYFSHTVEVIVGK